MFTLLNNERGGSLGFDPQTPIGDLLIIPGGFTNSGHSLMVRLASCSQIVNVLLSGGKEQRELPGIKFSSWYFVVWVSSH